jgi:hypothetical protein
MNLGFAKHNSFLKKKLQYLEKIKISGSIKLDIKMDQESVRVKPR